MIYFDSAATSFLRPGAVERAVLRSVREHAGYARSSHTAAEDAAKCVYSCREAAAELFSLDGPENVIFCMNATHALNIAIMGLAKSGGAVLMSGYEHNAVSRPVYALPEAEKLRAVCARSPLFDKDAALEAFRAAMEKEKIGLCVCNMVSNVFGNILPVAHIGALCRERGIPFVVDASQAAGSIEVSAKKLSADVICMPGHKGLQGPTGTGLMLLCGGYAPRPLLHGGTGGDSLNRSMPEYPPERYESGTMNIHGIAGLREGIRHVLANREKILERERMLCEYIGSGLKKLEGVRVFEGKEETAPILSFTAEGFDSEVFSRRLCEKGFAVRGGLHCAPLAHETAGTVESGTVRISPCGQNTWAQAERLILAVKEVLQEGAGCEDLF